MPSPKSMPPKKKPSAKASKPVTRRAIAKKTVPAPRTVVRAHASSSGHTISALIAALLVGYVLFVLLRLRVGDGAFSSFSNLLGDTSPYLAAGAAGAIAGFLAPRGNARATIWFVAILAAFLTLAAVTRWFAALPTDWNPMFVPLLILVIAAVIGGEIALWEKRRLSAI